MVLIDINDDNILVECGPQAKLKEKFGEELGTEYARKYMRAYKRKYYEKNKKTCHANTNKYRRKIAKKAKDMKKLESIIEKMGGDVSKLLESF